MDATAWRTAGLDPAWTERHRDDPCAWWLGTHHPSWAWDGTAKGPLFLSARVLRTRKSSYPRATVPIAIDSGGFTELTKFGGWTIPAAQYVDEIRRWSDQLGTVIWAAIQDWFCEPPALAATGLTVAEHQDRTIASLLDLERLAPEVCWLPVLQGQTAADYLQHVHAYARAGVDLRAYQLVGLGSVCKRQATEDIVGIVGELTSLGLRLHGFGVKAPGIRSVGALLHSADSLAWSFLGRRLTHTQGLRDSQGRNLANSPEFAEQFRADMLSMIEKSEPVREWQPLLPWFDDPCAR